MSGEDIVQKITEKILLILDRELQEFQSIEDPAERQKRADALSKLASIPRKLRLEEEGEGGEDEADLAQILSQLKAQDSKKHGKLAHRFVDEPGVLVELEELKRDLLAAHSLVVLLETHGNLDHESLLIAGELRRLLESLILRVRT